MHTPEFIDFGKAVIDFVGRYTDTLRDKQVLPSVEPGYLSKLIPDNAPFDPESWQDVLKDVEQIIVPGMTHWNSPNFHAYYPAGNSYPAIVAEILSAAFNPIGFSWMCSPAVTELEMITMDWLVKILSLPKEFLHSHDGPGGGVILGSASEATFVCLLAAKERTIRRIKNLQPDLDETVIRSKLVAYSSDQANSSVEKAGILASVPIKLLTTDDKCSLRGRTLKEIIEKDIEDGFYPCYVTATLGTTGTCAFDNLPEMGPICKEHHMWLHVDAAYAGAAFVCPEFRQGLTGIEYVDSFVFNPHKWFHVNFDCSAMWVTDSEYLLKALSVDRIYLRHQKQGATPDFRNWQIPLGRRFRSLKLWFVLRIYGVKGLQEYIRYTVGLSRVFEELVRSDDRFEMVVESNLSLVCFRMKGENDLTQKLLDRLTMRKNIYVVAATYKDKLIIRFAVGSRLSKKEDILYAWNEITRQASDILKPIEFITERNLIKETNKFSDDLVSTIENLNIECKNDFNRIS